MKYCFTAIDNYAVEPSPETMQAVRQSMSDAYSKIDKAVKRGALHANNGARKKSRLNRRLKRVDRAAEATV